MENWRTIEATNGTMEVSDNGNFRYNGEPYHSVRVDKTGYMMVYLKLNFGSRWFYVHRVVAWYFIENPDPASYTQVNHIDGNKENNNISNLEWVTPRQNQQHRIHALHKDMFGENNPMFGKGGEQSPVFKGYITQIDALSGEVIGQYAGSVEAAKAVNGNAGNIIRVLNKDNRTYYGCYWKREEWYIGGFKTS